MAEVPLRKVQPNAGFRGVPVAKPCKYDVEMTLAIRSTFAPRPQNLHFYDVFGPPGPAFWAPLRPSWVPLRPSVLGLLVPVPSCLLGFRTCILRGCWASWACPGPALGPSAALLGLLAALGFGPPVLHAVVLSGPQNLHFTRVLGLLAPMPSCLLACPGPLSGPLEPPCGPWL